MNIIKNKIEFILPLFSYICFSYIFFQSNNIERLWNSGDQASYINASIKLYNNFYIDPFRTLGYQIFLGFPTLFNINLLSILWPITLNLILLFLILNTIKSICVYLQINIIYVTILLCLSSSLFVHINLALTEILFMCISLLSCKYFIKLNTSNYKLVDIIICGTLIGLMPLIKPGYLFFSLILLFILLFKSKINPVYLLLPFFLLVSFQSRMIYSNYGKFKLSYIGSITYYRYLGSSIESLESNQKFHNCQIRRDNIIKNYSVNQIDSIAKIDFINKLQNDPIILIKSYTTNIFSNTLASNYENNVLFAQFNKIINIFFTCSPFLILFLILLRLKTFEDLIFPYTFILFTILISGISSMQGDRFHMVFYPFSALIIISFFKRIKKHQFN